MSGAPADAVSAPQREHACRHHGRLARAQDSYNCRMLAELPPTVNSHPCRMVAGVHPDLFQGEKKSEIYLDYLTLLLLKFKLFLF